MVKIKEQNARNSGAIVKFCRAYHTLFSLLTRAHAGNTEIDHFRLICLVMTCLGVPQ